MILCAGEAGLKLTDVCAAGRHPGQSRITSGRPRYNGLTPSEVRSRPAARAPETPGHHGRLRSAGRAQHRRGGPARSGFPTPHSHRRRRRTRRRLPSDRGRAPRRRSTIPAPNAHSPERRGRAPQSEPPAASRRGRCRRRPAAGRPRRGSATSVKADRHQDVRPGRLCGSGCGGAGPAGGARGPRAAHGGRNPAYLTAKIVDRVELYRVRVGPFKSRPVAEEVARRLEREGHRAPWVTK